MKIERRHKPYLFRNEKLAKGETKNIDLIILIHFVFSIINDSLCA